MKQSRNGMWWPEFECTIQESEDYILHRVTDALVPLQYVRTPGICVQAGGHVGFFPRRLAQHFTIVHTFEPVVDMFFCLQENLRGTQNAVVHNAALGAAEGTTMITPRFSGRSHINTQGTEEVPLTTIDSLQLPRCDLIYLDIEGYELEALAGAKETIAKYRPVITLEVLKGRDSVTLDWASRNDYQLAQKKHSDWTFRSCK